MSLLVQLEKGLQINLSLAQKESCLSQSEASHSPSIRANHPSTLLPFPSGNMRDASYHSDPGSSRDEVDGLVHKQINSPPA